MRVTISVSSDFHYFCDDSHNASIKKDATVSIVGVYFSSHCIQGLSEWRPRENEKTRDRIRISNFEEKKF
jgi:hypothetical protein